MQVVRLRGRKQDTVDPLAKQRAQERVTPGPETPQNTAQGLPQIFDRARPVVNRPQRIDQHHLPVDPREMGPEEWLHDLRFIRLEPALELSRQGSSRRSSRRQWRKGQGGRAFEIAGQQEPARRAIGIPRHACGPKIRGPSLGQRICPDLVQFRRRIHRTELRQKRGPLVARPSLFKRLGRPLRKRHLQQRQIQKPLTRIIDDIKVHCAWPRQARQQPARPHPERHAQLADRSCAFGPMGLRAGHRGQMAFEIEPRHGVVGLRLQKRRLDPAPGGGLKPGHAPAIHQVGDQRGDEHRLARPREPGNAQPDHRLEQHLRHAVGHRFDPPAQGVCNGANHQRGILSCL